MPLGVEVGFGPGDVVLDGIAAPPKRGTAPQFRSMTIVAERMDGWMKTPLGTKVGLGPCRPHCVRRGPSSPAKMTQQPLPSFRPMSLVATVAHLS